MKKLIAICFTALSITTTKSQSAKIVYAEILGPGLASLNFDMRLINKQDGLGFRAGIGGFSVGGGSSITTFPLGLNYLLGGDGKNYFELGANITFISVKESSSNSSVYSTNFGSLNFGYRLQPKTSGFVFRAAVNPLFNSDGFFPFYAGIAFGFKL